MPVNVPTPIEAMPKAAPTPIRMETAAQLRSHAPLHEGQQRGAESPFGQNSTNVDARLIEGQKAAADLKAVETQNPDPERVMDQARRASVPSLSTTEQSSLRRVDPGMAEQAIQFDTYSSIVAEAARNGQTVEQVAKGRGLQPADFNKMQGEVFQRIGNLSYLRQVIPGLDKLDPATRDSFVEQFFAANPAVREAYVAEMRGIAARAAAIPEAPTGSGRKGSEQAADRAEAGNRLRARLGEAGKGLTDADIADMFKGGKTVEEVRAQVFDRALEARGVNAGDVRARDGYRAEATTLETQMQVLDRQLSGNPPNRDVLVTQRQGLEQRLTQVRAAESKITVTPDQEATIADVDRQVYGFVDVRAGGVRTGGIEGELRAISQSLSAEQKLQSAPQTPEAQAAEAQRLLQIERLREEMNGAMEKAIDQTLRQQYDDAQDLAERKVQADQALLEKSGQDRLAQAEKKMLQSENDDWVGKDKAKRKRTVHRDQIGADIKRVAADGEEGVRRIMLRQMSTGEGATVQLTGPDGTPLQGYGPDGKPLVDSQNRPIPATWETVRMQDLREADRTLLNQLYDRQHVQLEDRLLRDFDFAKHPHGMLGGIADVPNLLGSLDSLHLTSDEYGYLHEQFGNRLDKAADASEAMRNLKAELKAKGIDTGGFMGLLMAMATLGAGFRKKEQ